MIGLPYIFGIRIDFLFFVVLFIAIVFLVLQKFKFSKIKIFLVIVFILVTIPIAWFFAIIDSGTAQRIYHKITIVRTFALETVIHEMNSEQALNLFQDLLSTTLNKTINLQTF